MIVDLALSATGSQLIASALPAVRGYIHSVCICMTRLERPTRTNALFYTTVSGVTSSLSEAARQAPKSSGYCMSQHHVRSRLNNLTCILPLIAIEWFGDQVYPTTTQLTRL